MPVLPASRPSGTAWGQGDRQSPPAWADEEMSPVVKRVFTLFSTKSPICSLLVAWSPPGCLILKNNSGWKVRWEAAGSFRCPLGACSLSKLAGGGREVWLEGGLGAAHC